MREDSELEPNPVIEAYKKDVDITLIRENLKRTPHERLLNLIELHRFWLELRRAGEAPQVRERPEPE